VVSPSYPHFPQIPHRTRLPALPTEASWCHESSMLLGKGTRVMTLILRVGASSDVTSSVCSARNPHFSKNALFLLRPFP